MSEITPDQVMSALEAQHIDSLNELEETLPNLGHSQAKRLLLAAMRYPIQEETFEEETLIKAFSACKRLIDVNVAMGTEIVIENMVKNHKENNNEQD